MRLNDLCTNQETLPKSTGKVTERKINAIASKSFSGEQGFQRPTIWSLPKLLFAYGGMQATI